MMDLDIGRFERLSLREWPPVYEAILIGEEDKVRDLLSAEGTLDDSHRFDFPGGEVGVDSDLRVPPLPGLTALHVAVLSGNLRVVELLLEAKVDIDAVASDPRGLTSLELSALLNRKLVVEQLIYRNAALPDALPVLVDFDPQSTPFTKEAASRCLQEMLTNWGAFSGRGNFFSHHSEVKEELKEEVIANLVKFGLNINQVNAEMETALHRFCRRAYSSIGNKGLLLSGIETLVKYGSNLLIQNFWGETVLMKAIVKGYPFECLKILVPKVDKYEAVDLYGFNAMALAMRDYEYHDVGDLLELLLINGFTFKQYFGGNLVELVTKARHYPEKKLKYLLSHGLEPNIRSFFACIKSSNVGLPRGALVREYLEHIGFLSEAIDDVDNKWKQYEMVSTDANLVSTLELVLQNGLKPTADDVAFYIDSEILSIVRLLVNHYDKSDLNEKVPNALISIMSRRDREELRILLPLIKKLVEDLHLDPNHTDHSSRESLLTKLIANETNGYYRLSNNFVNQCVDYFLSLPHIDVNVVGLVRFWENWKWESKMKTPLSVALNRGKHRVAQKLIRAFADVSTCDVKHMKFEPGFSLTLMLLYEAGYHFKETFYDESTVTDQDKEELKWFKEWLEVQKKSICLQTMAGKAVREVYGKNTESLVHDFDFSPEVESILLLTSIESQFKEVEEEEDEDEDGFSSDS